MPTYKRLCRREIRQATFLRFDDLEMMGNFAKHSSLLRVLHYLLNIEFENTGTEIKPAKRRLVLKFFPFFFQANQDCR